MITELGKYRIDSILGRGAMGVVYKAFDPWIERVVALKAIRKELFADDQQMELIRRFKNEAQAAGRLHHPNIVTVFDYGEDAESAYIAMEYVEGTPLDTLLAPGRPVDLARIAAWMGDLLAGLAYAHAHGVVHRDIKPANLLVAQGRIKVSDFGIARIESSTLTQAGAMVGTPSYMSPEQFRGEAVDGRADVFSAGIVLYQLLTGARPFSGSTATVMHQILNDHPGPPSALLPALGTRFDHVVATAMAKAPADRFASAGAFHDALARVLAEDAIDADRTMFVATVPPIVPVPVPADSSHPTITPWKRDALPEVEVILARQIGPMARFLLKKVAARAEGLDQLGDLLLPHVPSDGGRQEFLQGLEVLKRRLLASGTGAGAGTPLPAPPAPAAAPVDDAYVEAATIRLLALIGPIARIVVRRALKVTRDPTQFLQLLASHIDNLEQRARFVEGAP